MSAKRASLVVSLVLIAAACRYEPPVVAPAPAAAAPAPAAAEPPAPPPAKDATVYGAPLATAETLPLADLVRRAAELDGKQVRVEGTVADVCAKRGCWIKVAEEDGPAAVVFKVQDGVMVFPMSAKGKWAVADGTVRRTELTLEQTRKRMEAEAKEAGKPFDPASVTEPTVSVRLDGIGASVRDRK
jgi:hypothetical protein